MATWRNQAFQTDPRKIDAIEKCLSEHFNGAVRRVDRPQKQDEILCEVGNGLKIRIAAEVFDTHSATELYRQISDCLAVTPPDGLQPIIDLAVDAGRDGLEAKRG